MFSTSLFLSTKIFQFSAKFRKAPLEGSCRHCRLRGGSLLNFNHANGRPMVAPTHVPLKQQRTPITQKGRPMVAPTHVPLKQQRTPIMQTGDQWSPLNTFHSNNSELQSRKLATTGRHSEILINDSKLNHTKRATNCRSYYTTIHLYESVCKSHKPKHRLTKQLCISQKQQT